MDKKQTYNDQEQFRDHPLPDAGQSWEKMKKLLDEDDNNRRPVVPVLLKSCAGWGFLLLLTATVAWFLLKPGISPDRKISVQPKDVKTDPIPANSNKTGSKEQTEANPITTPVNPTPIHPVQSSEEQKQNLNKTTGRSSSVTKTIRPTIQKNKLNDGGINNGAENSINKSNSSNKEPNQLATGKKNAEQPQIISQEVRPTKNEDQKIIGVRIEPALEIRDSLSKKEAVVVKDTMEANLDSSKVQEKKKIVKSKPAFLISAGIGMQQQVPFADQKTVTQNYYGRTSALSDYIPSVYFRIEKEKKWFVQGEFRYGAPQSLKEFSYNRQTKLDSSFITTTSLTLKKTYYHQIPFSFNYYVLPNWSVGLGGIYSRFHGAISETEIRRLNIQTQSETVSKKLVNIKHFTDSFLYKTQMHVLLQTEYHWKRFAFGIRYTCDVQPFIKYKKPDGNINTEKNQTIQLMARFRIWQSQRKALRK